MKIDAPHLFVVNTLLTYLKFVIEFKMLFFDGV